jgi:hypothetical protein
LGQQINLAKGQLEIPAEKLKSLRKEVGKILKADHMSCRKLSSILGQIRSFLVSVPFLRLLTDHLCQMVNLANTWGWDHSLPIPQKVKDQVRELTQFLQPEVGRSFMTTPQRRLWSDSSQSAWGGLDQGTGAIVQEFWRERSTLHINQKELQAAVETIKSLAKPGETVVLHVDNQVAYSYLTKWGGRKIYLNDVIKPLLYWCKEKSITFQVNWVPTGEMLADKLTRWEKDPGDYTLSTGFFQKILKIFHKVIQPEVDMFASPGNKKFTKFCCRWMHHQAFLVDALKCPLVGLQSVYANPPWSVIPQWLVRLREHPHIKCLLLVPYWVSTPWWRLLIQLKVPGTDILLVKPHWGLFQNCWGQFMPGPKWPLACVIVSGGCYNSNRFKHKISRII